MCLENQQWDLSTEEVVSPKMKRKGALAITSARFDATSYQTILQLEGLSDPLEIEL